MKNNKRVESFGEFNESVCSDQGHHNDILDFSKAEANKIVPEGGDLTMRQLIIDRINQIYTKSSGPRLDLNVSDKELVSLFENLLRRLYQQ